MHFEVTGESEATRRMQRPWTWEDWKPALYVEDLPKMAVEGWQKIDGDVRPGQASVREIAVAVANVFLHDRVPGALRAKGPHFVLRTGKALASMGAAGLGQAENEIVQWKQHFPEQTPVLVVPVSPLMAFEPPGDPDQAPFTIDFVCRLAAIFPNVVVMAGEQDVGRLKGLPHKTYFLSPPSCPDFVRQVKPGDQAWVGRDNDLDTLVRMLRNQHVLITGPAGVGKTVLARALPNHRDFVGSTLLEVDLKALMAASGIRGVLERRVVHMLEYASHLPRCVLLLDELKGFVQRTGDGESTVAHDSVVDLLKSALARPEAPYRMVATCTDVEAASLSDSRRGDIAIFRRFAELRLPPPTLEEKDRIVRWWASRLGLPSTDEDMAEVKTGADLAYPKEHSPAREIKLMGLWRGKGTRARPLDVVRQQSPLSSPRIDALDAAMARCAEQIFGRSQELAALSRAIESATQRLLSADDTCRGPFLVVFLHGSPDTGKTHFARVVASSLDARAEHVRAIDLLRFIEQNRTQTGRAVVVEATGANRRDHDAPAAWEGEGIEASMLAEALLSLERWLVVFCVDGPASTAQDSSFSTHPVPTLWLPFSDARLDERERLAVAERLLPGIRIRAAQLGADPATLTPEVGRRAAESCSTPAEIEARLALVALRGEAALAAVPAAAPADSADVIPLAQALRRMEVPPKAT